VEIFVRKVQLLIPKDRRPVSAEMNVKGGFEDVRGGNDSDCVH